MLKNLFKPRPGVRIGDALYALAVGQARNVGFYTRLGVADRIDARFELYTLHVLLLVLRLRDENTEAGRDAAQALFDVYVSALDHALREEGVGDVSVGKKMRKLGEALYGRMNAYETPLRDDDSAALTEALARNVYAEAGAERAADLARYALAARAGLAAQKFNEVLAKPAWTDV
ncbi:MAG: ubiquinol-cytochrome C chaperone family protein [Brevundimonas sp.]|jgi:cytochrome b pre-mRNA-processing protein 3